MRRPTRTTQVDRRLLALVDSGESIYAAAQRTGLHVTQVQEVLDDYGFPDREKLAAALARLDGEAVAATVQADQDTMDRAAGPAPDRELRFVALGDLQGDPENPRESLTGIEELAESIDSVGLLQPLVVRRRGDRLIVVAGHRRLAAVQLLRHARVECVITREMAPDHVLQAMLVENGQRAGLDPIEEARALQRLKEQTGDNGLALGRRIGRSQAYVDGRLALLALPIEDQERVRAGQLGITQAIERGRVLHGNVRPTHMRWYLSDAHPLAKNARARCRKVHGRAQLVGGVACGECWETVFRADERSTLHRHSTSTGRCALCQSPVVDFAPEPQEAETAASA